MALTDMFTGGAAGGFLATFIAGFLILFLVIFLAVYIYAALALMAIANKTKTPNSWMAWIPIANVYLITQMAGVSGWWTFIIFAAWIPVVGGLLTLAAMIWMFWRIAEEIEMPGWTSLLLIIPLVNLVILGIYAWKK